MAQRFPVIIEREGAGMFSAYVAGLPVYAQGVTRSGVERAIQRTLSAYCQAHPEVTESQTTVRVASLIRRIGGQVQVTLVGPGALVGGKTSKRKAASSRANGQLGGRPRKALLHEEPAHHD